MSSLANHETNLRAAMRRVLECWRTGDTAGEARAQAEAVRHRDSYNAEYRSQRSATRSTLPATVRSARTTPPTITTAATADPETVARVGRLFGATNRGNR